MKGWEALFHVSSHADSRSSKTHKLRVFGLDFRGLGLEFRIMKKSM